MGIHINGDQNEVNVVHGDVYYGDGYGGLPPRPPVGFFGLLGFFMLLFWVVAKFWWIVLIVVSVTALSYGAHLELERKRQAELEAQRRKQALAARAERQNEAYLQGEPWGLYGNFPPPPEVRP